MLACGIAAPAAPAAAAPCAPWPDYAAFMARYLSADGRVLDADSARHVTVSEGEAYALLFALVARDERRFARIAGWTADNLAGGDLARRLPAWQWGRRDDGSYGVLDDNSAADADLWLAYDLLEAGRLWHRAGYRATGRALAARILAEETADVTGLGRVLLPGAHGFGVEGGWRLNPSYLPLEVLRRLARAADPGYRALAASAAAAIAASAPHGFVPDWIVFRAAGGTAPDPVAGARGSYDAVRVYLWAGMLAPADPARQRLLALLAPMARAVAGRGAPPASIDAAAGSAAGTGPPGFSAALVPFLASAGEWRAAARERRRAGHVADPGSGYYDDALRLFGLGWAEGRFRFGTAGELVVRRGPACA